MTDYPEQADSGLAKLVSPALDCLAMAAYLYFLPWLARSFLNPSWVNGVIIGVAFVLLLAAIQSLKELAYSTKERKPGVRRTKRSSQGDEKREDAGSDCCCSPMFYTMGCTFLYCAFLALVFLQTATKVDLDSSAGETAGAWLLLGGSLVVLLMIVLPASGGVRPKSGTGLVLHAISVVGIALISIVGMAFWESMKLADPGGSPEQFHGIWKLIIFLLLVIVFVALLGPPRIYLHLIKGDRWGLVTYIASMGYYVWDLFEF